MARSDRLKQAIAQWRDGFIREFQRELEPHLKERGIRGGSYATINRYLNGKPQPPMGFLVVAAEMLGVRSEWLIVGSGAMTEAEEAVTDPLEAPLESWHRALQAVSRDQRLPLWGTTEYLFHVGGPATIGLFYAAVQRLVASCPDLDVPTSEQISKLGALVFGLVFDPPTKLCRIEHPPGWEEATSPPRVADGYFTAALHAVMLAIPDRKQGRPLSELIHREDQ